MISHSYLLAVIIISIQECCGETVLTQTPEYISSSLGEAVSINCKASTDIDDDIIWYQQKQGQPPKLLMYYNTNRMPDLPDRFIGTGYGYEFTLTINGMHQDDEAIYFCQQDDNSPYTQ
uniref:Ig-like domain-containing protein n=1 Tax=Pyxicephalus adspersus TaxID=30357 RepID=A0AAV3ADQ9_PYXAD|nr:TPA: hypothetical protein GDO54_009656 [Pyxicephalus adspersus]